MAHPEPTNHQKLIRLKKRQLALLDAREHLLRYCEMQMPDPADFEDPDLTRFVATPQARMLCQIMEKVESGKLKRVAVSIGPQLGKSAIMSRAFPAWCTGRDPYRNLMLGTYNQTFAEEFGGEVRTMIEAPIHQAVFPGHRLAKSALNLMITEQGGKTAFVGVGGSGTGKPADFFVVDDPIRSDEDAQSQLYRDKIWSWFNSVVFTRCHSKSGIAVVHCLTGDTQITLADSTTKRLDEIKPGDKVLSWDGRTFVGRQVLATVDNGPDQTYLIRTKNAGVRANARHPFLVLTGDGLRWVKTKHLRPGMRIVRHEKAKTKESFAPSTTAASRSLAEDCAESTTLRPNGLPGTDRRPTVGRSEWLGEESADTGSHLSISTACSTSKTGCAPSVGQTEALAGRDIGLQTSFRTTITTLGSSEVCFATIATESPEELAIPQFWNEPSNTSALDTDIVESVIPHGIEHVFDLTVDDTHNFIANGLLSHNTRWHEDDLIGRLCDPNHPERDKQYKGIADDWTYINIPAVIEDPKLAAELGLTLEVPTESRVLDQFGDKPMSALWPERKGLAFLSEAKRMDPRTFQALYMGQPTREDGEYFKAEHILEYDPADLPKDLKIYGASDHAVSTKQDRDPTVLGCVGVDDNDDIWVLPDIVWRQMQTDQTVEELLMQFKLHKPQLWWMESELISKSFGPFLHKRMLEEKIYVTIDPVIPAKDKQTRARAIQGRMSMGKVHLPRFAPWYQAARREILRFPYGTHDDFVDFLSHIGMGLVKARGLKFKPANDDGTAAVGSIQWIMQSALKRANQEQRAKAAEGW